MSFAIASTALTSIPAARTGFRAGRCQSRVTDNAPLFPSGDRDHAADIVHPELRLCFPRLIHADLTDLGPSIFRSVLMSP